MQICLSRACGRILLESPPPLAQVAGQLRAPSAKALSYEMAVCVCHADGLLQEPEKRFLADLRQALQLESSSVDEHQQTVQAMIALP